MQRSRRRQDQDPTGYAEVDERCDEWNEGQQQLWCIAQSHTERVRRQQTGDQSVRTVKRDGERNDRGLLTGLYDEKQESRAIGRPIDAEASIRWSVAGA